MIYFQGAYGQGIRGGRTGFARSHEENPLPGKRKRIFFVALAFPQEKPKCLPA